MDTVMMRSPKGSAHSGGMPWRPRMIPSSAPIVAAVQSVSSPQLAAMRTERPKSPSP